MPFGLPALNSTEHSAYLGGSKMAPVRGRAPLPPLTSQRIQTWERFFTATP